MANIEIERKSGVGVWPWVIGLVVAALLVWALIGAMNDDPEVVATAPGEVALPPAEAEGAVAFSEVIGNPGAYIGRELDAFEAQAMEVSTDRGFWVATDDGQRMFVVINEGGPGIADTRGAEAEQPHINVGNRLRISQATVRDASYLSSIAGPLDDQTRSIVQEQPAYLIVQAEHVSVIDR